MQLSVGLKCETLALALGFLAGCVEIPGHFYLVKLPEPQPKTVCMDLARALTASLPLQIVDQTFPTRPKGQCIMDLDYQGHSPPRAPIGLLYDPQTHQIGIRVALKGPIDTEHLALQMTAIVAERFPGATVSEIHPRQGFAP
jgi:hypothetical protein